MSKPWVNRISMFAQNETPRQDALQAPVSDALNVLNVGAAIVEVKICSKLAVEHFRGR